jgi:hypothetical protein
LESIGWIDSIYDAAINIEAGRKGFATRGKEGEGRISYEKGIEEALTAFQKAQISADAQTLILAEYTLLSQELQFCNVSDSYGLSSLTQALQSFNDAFLVLDVVDDKSLYPAVEKAFPHHKKYRESTFPKDSFHIACNSHKTRIQNNLCTHGVDPIEKSLLKQRLENLGAAQKKYIEQQGKSLEKRERPTT